MPAFALFAVTVTIIDIGPAWQAAHGDGRAGTLHLDSRSCTRFNCEWRGQFRSDDGTVVRRDALMHDPVPLTARPGDEIRARDTGDRTGVFALTGSHDWQLSAALLGGGSGYLLGWALWLIDRVTERRRGGPREIPGLPS